jgi:hypothetical protein
MSKYRKLAEDERAQIGSFANHNPNIALLARQFNCSRHTVYIWLEEGGKAEPDYKNSEGQGRHHLLSSAERSEARKWARAGETARTIVEKRARRGRKPASISTIQRVLKGGRKPLAWRRQCNKKGLSSDNISKRLTFCHNNLQADCSTWVFLDAKYYCLSKGGSKYAHFTWQVRDEPPPAATRGTTVVFLFYAAVALGHKSQLYFVPPSPPAGSAARKTKQTFKSESFITMISQLKTEVDQWYKAGQQYFIIMDHARQHKSKASTQALASMHAPVKHDFPARSWDLNIIENVWGVLDDHMLHKSAIANEGWKVAIQEAWHSIKLDTINKLVQSLGHRMSAIIGEGGQWLAEGWDK